MKPRRALIITPHNATPECIRAIRDYQAGRIGSVRATNICGQSIKTMRPRWLVDVVIADRDYSVVLGGARSAALTRRERAWAERLRRLAERARRDGASPQVSALPGRLLAWMHREYGIAAEEVTRGNRITTVKLPEEMLEALDALADVICASRSQVMRAALAVGLREVLRALERAIEREVFNPARSTLNAERTQTEPGWEA